MKTKKEVPVFLTETRVEEYVACRIPCSSFSHFFSHLDVEMNSPLRALISSKRWSQVFLRFVHHV